MQRSGPGSVASGRNSSPSGRHPSRPQWLPQSVGDIMCLSSSPPMSPYPDGPVVSIKVLHVPAGPHDPGGGHHLVTRRQYEIGYFTIGPPGIWLDPDQGDV
eukprot:12043481-Prorocentrum_lima.AAC.1